jgi:alanine dehydrogenase
LAQLLFDHDVAAGLSAELAVDAARRALVDAYQGRLQAPPRLYAQIGNSELVFTAGGYPEGNRGVRIYQTGLLSSDQAVLVWDGAGRLAGCVVGFELGARRTGGLGAVAADALARADAETVAVIGSGRQAWTQLWALTTVRTATAVCVYRPTKAHRAAFAERARQQLSLKAAPVASPREAVTGADIIVLATRSPQPVIEAAWVQEGAHVTTVGPKTVSAHETPTDLAAPAAIVVSDSPAQAASYEEAFFTDRELLHLGGIVCGDLEGRMRDADITLYASTGLAGSEVVTAAALLDGPDRSPTPGARLAREAAASAGEPVADGGDG